VEKFHSIKIGQEKRVLQMKTNIHFWSHLAQFLQWQIFQKKFVEKIKIHILCSKTFFSENLAVYEIV